MHAIRKTEARLETKAIQVLKQEKHLIPKGITCKCQANDVIKFRVGDINDEWAEGKAVDSG